MKKGFACGKKDGLIRTSQGVHGYLKEKGVPHVWCNLSESPLQMLIVFSRGHIERLFREVAARENDDIAAILDKFGCLIVGPALLESVYSISSPRDMT